MVFFTCNACNESLKKNQVEKHYMTKCRRCEFLSCIDCGKEFWGDSYQTHTKCVSEEEKYSGKNFVAKANKGEVKQGQWIEKVQSAIQKAPANPQLKNLLQRLEDFPNVPRKKAKFENFLKCSLRVMNKGLTDQVWDLLMAESQQQNGSSTTTTASEGESNTSSIETTKQNSTAESADPDDAESERKLSKRERKENRKKKAHKAEKKDKQTADVAEEDSGKKKKGKRRKREEEEEEEEQNSCEAVSQPKKKKRKGENGVAVAVAEVEENGDDDDPLDTTLTSEKKGKFDWGHTIMAVLQAKKEISVKRLQKKVLAEYASYGGGKPEEKVVSKFNKKLSKLPNVRVLKDKAKLIQS